MKLEIEYELNRKWIYDNEKENIIGETNFIVPAEWLKNIFEKLNNENKLVCKYNNFDNFIEAYEPETDGELIYQAAIRNGVLTEDLGNKVYRYQEGLKDNPYLEK